jgi:hypothetical protein
MEPTGDLGRVTVAATDKRLAELRTVTQDGIFIHYSAAKRLVENFQWRCVKLDFSRCPVPAPKVSIEAVVPLVSALLSEERARLPSEERHCFFCAEAVALDDEYMAWHHRASGSPPSVLHLVVMAHTCRKPSCKKETNAWVATVRAKPTEHVLQYQCAQCGSVSAPGTKFLACGHCLAVNYCSEECQRKHRAVHRAFCQSVVVGE